MIILCFRLLTEYHSFLFNDKLECIDEFKVSVSLRSIIHSYKDLIFQSYNTVIAIMFPSPYGVSFILILKSFKNEYFINLYKVSVSLWSIIHSYRREKNNKTFTSLVSVSLWSIIHSYLSLDIKSINILYLMFPSPYGVSFILINGLTSHSRFIVD